MSAALRLMTWNLRSLRDDRSAIVQTLTQVAPDVLFVQESPRFFRAASKLAWLARESGLVVCCGGRSTCGPAMLTSMRVNVDRTFRVLLPATPGFHRRGAALASLRFGDLSWLAASVHLGLDPVERQHHAALVADLLAEVPDLPAAIGGDMNDMPGRVPWNLLQRDRQDVGAAEDLRTYPAREPKSRIDAIFLPTGWKAVTVSASDIVGDATLVRATDHRPVIVDVMD